MKPENPKLSICLSSDGKYRFIGSIYIEDTVLHEMSCAGFASYYDADDARTKYGYLPFDVSL